MAKINPLIKLKKHLLTAASVSLVLLATACSKVPSDVIQPHEMARLLADVHIGEAVIDGDRRIYHADSMKQKVKQSVYARHGVSVEEVDSSLMWYGRNIKYYMEVYDETIEILEHRLIETGNRVAAANALSIAGDSVDVWPGARYIVFNNNMPSNIITFSYERDHNWERGDSYTWRGKFFNTSDNWHWMIGAEYADGSVEYLNSQLSGDGWKEIKLQTDSLLEPIRIFGYLSVDTRTSSDLRLDSLEMVRKRVNRNDYRRPYSVFRRGFYPPTEIAPDSIASHADNITPANN